MKKKNLTSLFLAIVTAVIIIAGVVLGGIKEQKENNKEVDCLIIGKYDGQNLQYIVGDRSLDWEIENRKLIIIYDEEIQNEYHIYVNDDERFKYLILGDHITLKRVYDKGKYVYTADISMLEKEED